MSVAINCCDSKIKHKDFAARKQIICTRFALLLHYFLLPQHTKLQQIRMSSFSIENGLQKSTEMMSQPIFIESMIAVLRNRPPGTAVGSTLLTLVRG